MNTIKLILGVGLVSLLPGIASATLVTDGTFTAAGTPGSFASYSSGSTMGGWTVTSGSVDLIGGYWQGVNGNSVDLAGNGSGSISQNLTLAAGTYTLSFFESGNPDGSPLKKMLDVTLGGVSQMSSFTIGSNTHADMDYIPVTMTFTVASGATSLRFADISSAVGFGAGGTPYGDVISDVVLTPSAVPEASTILSGAMMLLPFGASVLRIARKKSLV